MWDELKRGGQADLKAAVSLFVVRDEITDALLRRDLKPRLEFEKIWFTKRELKILQRVAEFFRDLRAEDMTEFSHGKKGPWDLIFGGGKGQGQPIPPELSLDSEPLMSDVPTIEREELKYRQELLRDTA